MFIHFPFQCCVHSRTGAALTPLSALRGWHLVMHHLRGLCKKNSSHQFSPVCAPGKLVPTGHGMPKVCSRGVCDGSHWTRLLQQWIWLSVKSEDMNNRASPCWHLHCDGWLPDLKLHCKSVSVICMQRVDISSGRYAFRQCACCIKVENHALHLT